MKTVLLLFKWNNGDIRVTFSVKTDFVFVVVVVQ